MKIISFADWVKKQCAEFFCVAGIPCNSEGVLLESIQETHMFPDSGGSLNCRYNSPFAVYTRRKRNRTVVQIISLRRNRRGFAVCQNDKDAFDPRTAIAIAWARYKGIPIPKCRASKLSELPIGATFMFSYDATDEYEYVGFSKTFKKCCAVLISTGQVYSISDQVVYY